MIRTRVLLRPILVNSTRSSSGTSRIDARVAGDALPGHEDVRLEVLGVDAVGRHPGGGIGVAHLHVVVPTTELAAHPRGSRARRATRASRATAPAAPARSTPGRPGIAGCRTPAPRSRSHSPSRRATSLCVVAGTRAADDRARCNEIGLNVRRRKSLHREHATGLVCRWQYLRPMFLSDLLQGRDFGRRTDRSSEAVKGLSSSRPIRHDGPGSHQGGADTLGDCERPARDDGHGRPGESAGRGRTGRGVGGHGVALATGAGQGVARHAPARDRGGPRAVLHHGPARRPRSSRPVRARRWPSSCPSSPGGSSPP